MFPVGPIKFLRFLAGYAPCTFVGMALITEASFAPITYRVIGCAIKVHKALGPGVLEEPDRLALAHDMRLDGLRFATKVSLPVVYDGRMLGKTYEMDFLVEDLVVVEIKCVKCILEIHKEQLRNYMKLSGKPAGLLINFNVPLLKDGIVRMLNDKKPK